MFAILENGHSAIIQVYLCKFNSKKSAFSKNYKDLKIEHFLKICKYIRFTLKNNRQKKNININKYKTNSNFGFSFWPVFFDVIVSGKDGVFLLENTIFKVPMISENKTIKGTMSRDFYSILTFNFLNYCYWICKHNQVLLLTDYSLKVSDISLVRLCGHMFLGIYIPKNEKFRETVFVCSNGARDPE